MFARPLWPLWPRPLLKGLRRSGLLPSASCGPRSSSSWGWGRSSPPGAGDGVPPPGAGNGVPPRGAGDGVPPPGAGDESRRCGAGVVGQPVMAA